jgi:protease I
MARYSGVVFVGGEGARELANDANAQRLAREAAAEGKLVAAWGDAVAVLARAGVIKGKRITGKRTLASEVANSGGKFTGQQVERDGNVVTGLDDASGLRFGRALVRVVGI